MGNLIQSEIVLNEEIAHFCAESSAYYAVTLPGRMLMIKKWVLLYPEPQHEEHYSITMCVDTQEGFFLLRQDFNERKPSPWFIEKQLFPADSENFLMRYKSAFEQDTIITMMTPKDAEREDSPHA